MDRSGGGARKTGKGLKPRPLALRCYVHCIHMFPWHPILFLCLSQTGRMRTGPHDPTMELERGLIPHQCKPHRKGKSYSSTKDNIVEPREEATDRLLLHTRLPFKCFGCRQHNLVGTWHFGWSWEDLKRLTLTQPSRKVRCKRINIHSFIQHISTEWAECTY